RELVGANVSHLTPEPIRSMHVMFMERFLETGQESMLNRTTALLAVNKMGQLIPVLGALRAMDGGFGSLFQEVITSDNFILFNPRTLVATAACGRSHTLMGSTPTMLAEAGVPLLRHFPHAALMLVRGMQEKGSLPSTWTNPLGELEDLEPAGTDGSSFALLQNLSPEFVSELRSKRQPVLGVYEDEEKDPVTVACTIKCHVSFLSFPSGWPNSSNSVTKETHTGYQSPSTKAIVRLLSHEKMPTLGVIRWRPMASNAHFRKVRPVDRAVLESFVSRTTESDTVVSYEVRPSSDSGPAVSSFHGTPRDSPRPLPQSLDIPTSTADAKQPKQVKLVLPTASATSVGVESKESPVGLDVDEERKDGSIDARSVTEDDIDRFLRDNTNAEESVTMANTLNAVNLEGRDMYHNPTFQDKNADVELTIDKIQSLDKGPGPGSVASGGKSSTGTGTTSTSMMEDVRNSLEGKAGFIEPELSRLRKGLVSILLLVFALAVASA
ncbi:unnamed protein product, partial [Symbiodinium sp. KB8]